ncbi:hypothetical protein [Chromobacterium sphagni]|uniref:hypothetical protein n=1 Tax=Chromobacterium sphagni TaxID=1903179 RepID=UPI0019D3BEF3|nr:hypothetical protein [Chromobacterium sphagni]
MSKEVHDKLGKSVNGRVDDIWWFFYDQQVPECALLKREIMTSSRKNVAAKSRDFWQI